MALEFQGYIHSWRVPLLHLNNNGVKGCSASLTQLNLQTLQQLADGTCFMNKIPASSTLTALYAWTLTQGFRIFFISSSFHILSVHWQTFHASSLLKPPLTYASHFLELSLNDTKLGTWPSWDLRVSTISKVEMVRLKSDWLYRGWSGALL